MSSRTSIVLVSSPSRQVMARRCDTRSASVYGRAEIDEAGKDSSEVGSVGGVSTVSRLPLDAELSWRLVELALADSDAGSRASIESKNLVIVHVSAAGESSNFRLRDMMVDAVLPR